MSRSIHALGPCKSFWALWAIRTRAARHIRRTRSSAGAVGARAVRRPAGLWTAVHRSRASATARRRCRRAARLITRFEAGPCAAGRVAKRTSGRTISRCIPVAASCWTFASCVGAGGVAGLRRCGVARGQTIAFARALIGRRCARFLFALYKRAAAAKARQRVRAFWVIGTHQAILNVHCNLILHHTRCRIDKSRVAHAAHAARAYDRTQCGSAD